MRFRGIRGSRRAPAVALPLDLADVTLEVLHAVRHERMAVYECLLEPAP